MPRRLVYAPDEQAALALAEMVGAGKPRKPRRRGFNALGIRGELEVLLAAEDYENMRPAHLVALYVRCHEKVYGVTPAEMNVDAWLGASSAATKLVKVEFAGSITAAVEFMRWTWRREQWREKKAKHDGERRLGHIGWRLQFVLRHLLTDYRIDVARGRGQ